MSTLGKYLFRKVVYVGLSTGTLAMGSYLMGHPDVTDWTLKGAGIAAGTAAWGGILSKVLGGSLSNK